MLYAILGQAPRFWVALKIDCMTPNTNNQEANHEH